jgi:hypothetical protein
MDFFTRYPMMTPHIGSNYYNRTKPSLLLVGESHYLPDGATQHRTPAEWYGGNGGTLTSDEAHWINTSAVLAEAYKDNFRNRAHGIWKNAFEVINDAGPQYSASREVANDVAFVNFFLRPALKRGGSLAGHLTDKDVELANTAFAMRLERLAPTAIVFVSRLSLNRFQPVVPLTVPVISTPHPTSHWWNRAAKSYGGKRGRDVLAEFIATLQWPKAGVRGWAANVDV